MIARRTPIQIALLGDLALRRKRAAVDLSSAKLRAILALLALHADRVVPVPTLIHALWGAEPLTSARHLLHTYVARLRHAMEPDTPRRARINVIDSGPSGYQLVTKGVRIDVMLFRWLRELAVHWAASGRPARAFELLGRATGLWRDPSLRCLDELLPHSAEVEALRREWVDTALEYVSLGVELGRATTAWPLAERLAKAEPMDERVQARYLTVLDEVGRRTAAISHYQDLHARLSDKLGVEPGRELTDVYRNLLGRPAAPPGSTGPANPDPRPAAATGRSPWRGPGAGLAELLGRKQELQGITDHLACHRLISVTGPPGVGKSHLALHAAALLHDRFVNGVLVVDCAEVTTEEELRERLLAMLGGPASTDLTSAVATQQALILLDNAEHVVEPVAAAVDEMLRGSWRMRVIVSSREALGLPDETVLRLAPLPVPQVNDAGWPDDLASVMLFVLRARQLDPDFQLNASNVAHVARICRELDGLPLAVEITAACLATYDVATVVTRMRNPLRDIRPLRRGRPAHHHSLRASFTRSLDCLSEQERWCFGRLSALPRYFRLSDAVEVCATPLCGLDVEKVLARLVHKSLLVPGHGAHGPGYQILRLLHRFAAELAEQEPPAAPA